MFIESAIADTDTITIQETEVPGQDGAGASVSEGLSSLVPMLLIFGVFYFLLIRPQEKKRREQDKLISGVKKGEEVLTNAGLFGVVTKINDSDNIIMVQIAEGIEIKLLKSAIADIVSRSSKEVVKTVEKTSKKKKK
ncbi:MAG: preprotein translocase subunit YajC [Rickettsiaceae bacterium]|nr:preprotein translocase subunit YajC [Rickettsiaceae bacterium]